MCLALLLAVGAMTSLRAADPAEAKRLDNARSESRPAASIPGTILYEKSWEDGLIDSDSWMHQAEDTLKGVVNGIVYGTVSVRTGLRGNRFGEFSLPANRSDRQGAMMLRSRKVTNGSDEWFAMAYYFPTNWPAAGTSSGGTKMSISLGCPNYYSVNACQVAVLARPRSMFTLINAGACPLSGVAPGCPWYSATPDGGNYSRCRGFKGKQCGPLYIVRPGKLKLNVWHEIIMHVYYTLDHNGVVEFWHRVKGPRSRWRKTVSVSGGFPTLQTGPTSFGTTVTRSNLDGWPSTDQFGLYRWPNDSPATLRADNWCRATSFAAAASCIR
jgi:hypothetical protein